MLQIALASLVLLNPAIAQSKPCPALVPNVSDPKFQAGQVWTYQTRPGELGSTLTILQIDRTAELGVIVHVRVDGLKVLNPRGEIVPSVEHMPFTRDALLMSVLGLLRSTDKRPTMQGYDRWRAYCGGVYTIPVADAISVMERTFNAP
jgi:hypothetical protein